MLFGNHILCYHLFGYIVCMAYGLLYTQACRRLCCVQAAVCCCRAYDGYLPKLSTGLGPRSSYIIVDIYGYMTVRITVRAYCSGLEQKPICPLPRPVTAPENTVHTAPRPLGQLESTSNSWCVMIGWNNL